MFASCLPLTVRFMEGDDDARERRLFAALGAVDAGSMCAFPQRSCRSTRRLGACGSQ
jgi:hypothetical protein